MMYRQWLAECLDNLKPVEGLPSLWSLALGKSSAAPADLERAAAVAAAQVEALPPLGLARPRSRCDHCGHAIRWYQNVPVLSYLLLRGRCASCGTSIGPRSPAVELVTGLLFALCAWRFGLTVSGALWAAFCALLLCQFFIDLDTKILPDSLNYLLLWMGLVAAAMGWTTVALGSAVWGAVLGYLALWLVFHAYRLATGKEGMGHGDFKLLAALGAWLGAPYLVAIILLSSVVGSVLGVILLVSGRLANKDIAISFGPFLAGAGLLAFVLGPASLPKLIPFAFPFGG
jgi:leader peptidase (prepilin peptidase)/N-methyltransferase